MTNEQMNLGATEVIQPQVDSPVSTDTSSIENTNVENNVNVDAQPVVSEAPKQGKTFTEDQMRIISNDVKRRTEEKLKAEYESRYGVNQNLNNSVEPVNSDNIENVVKYTLAKELENYQRATFTANVESNFVNKLSPALQADPTLVEKLNTLNFGALNPHSNKKDSDLLEMLSTVENTGEVVSDIANNPEKWISIKNLYDENPVLAITKIAELSFSLKRNKEALAKPKSAPVRDQLEPTNQGLGNGEPSIEFKRKNDSRFRC